MINVTRYAVIETALCIGSNLMEGEVFMVMATDHYRELAALREELAQAKRNEHNSEVAYKAAIEKQGELREELAYYKNAERMPNKTLAWRGINVYDEVVTDWIEGEAPETMYDLQDRPAHYHKIERAYSAPETELVAVVEYTGYEPSNSLKWLNKGLGYMKPGTKLYAVQPTESGASESQCCDRFPKCVCHEGADGL
jgi:hypothetical protein